MAPATEPRAVVVGVGRSGTGYSAALLNHIGLRCGHESWWNPLGEREAGLDADSSWCAVGHLDEFEGAIFHVVRHPLAIVTSLYLTPDWGPFVAARGAPEGLSRLGVAMWTTLTWGGRCDDLLTWGPYRVEWDDEMVSFAWTAAKILGEPVSPERAIEAVAALRSQRLNNHNPSGVTLGWDILDAEDPELAGSLRDLAARWGY